MAVNASITTPQSQAQLKDPKGTLSYYIRELDVECHALQTYQVEKRMSTNLVFIMRSKFKARCKVIKYLNNKICICICISFVRLHLTVIKIIDYNNMNFLKAENGGEWIGLLSVTPDLVSFANHLISKKRLFQILSDVVIAVVADPVKGQRFYTLQSVGQTLSSDFEF